MSNTFESTVSEHIRGFERDLETVNTELYDLEWKRYFSIDSDKLRPLREKSITIYNDLDNFRKIKALARDERTKELPIPIKKALFKWERELSKEILPTEELKKKALLLAEVQDELTRKRGEFRVKVDVSSKAGDELAFEETQNILREEENRELRKNVWEKRCNLGIELNAKGFKKLVSDRNSFAKEQAKALNKDNPDSYDFYKLRLEQMDFNEEELFAIFQNLKESTDNATFKVLDERRKTYSYESIEPWDVTFFTYRESDELNGFYKLNELENNVAATVGGMGFLPRDYNLTLDLYPKSGKLDNAFVFPIQPPRYQEKKYTHRGDLRLFANLINGGLREQRTLFHEWGHLLHNAETKQDFYLFRGFPDNPSLTEGIAMLFELLPLEDEFFKKTLYKDEEIPSTTATLLKKQKVHRIKNSLLEMRLILARIYFERAIYKDPQADFAKIWSKCMSDFMFVQKRDAYEAWVERPHFVSSPVYYQCYAVAGLLREQFYSHMKSKFKNLVGNVDAGNFLKEKCFNHGNSLKWDEIVENMVGEKLNHTAFIKAIETI